MSKFHNRYSPTVWPYWLSEISGCLTTVAVWQQRLSDNSACLKILAVWQDRQSDNINRLTTSIMPYRHYPTLRNFKFLQLKKKVHDHILTWVSKSDGFRSFFHYFWCQNWDQWHKMSGKNSHIYFFSTLGSKIEWKKLGKTEKIPKT